jgi:hypothetical protein
MTQFVYPRLPDSIAHARIEEIKTAAELGGLAAVEALAQIGHPQAAPVATGGRVVEPARIKEVREAAIAAVEGWRVRGRVGSDEAAFDRYLGRALHERLDILPADASHSGTWSFLTLIVMPDIALLRFPGMHPDRLYGGRRNVLRRTWYRQEVLGDLMHASDRPLAEDELVGLLERTALARNRALVRRLALAVLTYDGTMARSEWAHKLYLRVTFTTGARLLDGLSDEEFDTIIREARGAE